MSVSAVACELRRIDLAGPVVAALELGDPRLVDVEAGDRELARQGDGQRQPDIAEADHDDTLRITHRGSYTRSLPFRMQLRSGSDGKPGQAGGLPRPTPK